ncbi:MAG: hypothetical protein ACI837_001846 [Crocinitomicaceae bacterium]|jgi:hypothetical protein
MKRLTFLIIGILLIPVSHAQEVEQAQIDFANKFTQVVTDQSMKGVIKLMGKDYRKEQIKNLGGNKVQFVDELFSGVDMLSEMFVNTNLLDITKIEIAEIQNVDDGELCTFRVQDGKHDILCTLLLVKKGKHYDFVGAIG